MLPCPEEVTVIATATGSGTSELGVNLAGQLLARGYGERHGLTRWGGTHVSYHYGEWRIVCAESHDWAAYVRQGVSLHAYVQARERLTTHEEALAYAVRVSADDPPSGGGLRDRA